tara:strand:+ start:699 stop:944 length:246 start_codon:yes stop_codon:yes gene_type:complete
MGFRKFFIVKGMKNKLGYWRRIPNLNAPANAIKANYQDKIITLVESESRVVRNAIESKAKPSKRESKKHVRNSIASQERSV